MGKNILKQSIYSFFSFIGMFFLVFDLRIFGFFGSAFIVLFFSLIYFILNSRDFISRLEKVVSCFSLFLILFLIYLIFVSFRVYVDMAQDVSYWLSAMKSLVILLATLFYLAIFYKSNIILNIVNVFFVNALVCIFFGTFPDNKFIISYFQYPTTIGGNELIGMNEYRNAFLSGSGYFGVASLYSLVVPIVLYYIFLNKNFFNFVKLFFVLIAGVLAGRIALVAYFISFVLFSFFKRKISLILVFFTFTFLGYMALDNLVYFEDANAWISELYKSEKLSDSTTIQDLKQMLYVPTELTLLFGDGRYKSEFGGYYGSTDIGYMRNILFGGLGFVLILLLCFISIFYKVRKNSIVYILIIISLFLHFKGVFILNNPGFLPIILSFVFYLYIKNKFFFDSKSAT